MSLDKLYHEISRELEINVDDLSHELQRQPGKFAYWATLFARATKKLAKQKAALRELEAVLSRDYRIGMADREPTVRVTESMVTTFIVLTDEHKEQVSRVIYAQHEEDLLSGAKEGFRQRSQALLELGRQRREEMQGADLSIFTKETKGRYSDHKRSAANQVDGLLSGKKSGL